MSNPSLAAYSELSATAQAACLLAALKPHRAWEVEEAWADLAARGEGWLDRARHGVDALGRFAPELGAGEWLDAGCRGKRKTREKK